MKRKRLVRTTKGGKGKWIEKDISTLHSKKEGVREDRKNSLIKKKKVMDRNTGKDRERGRAREGGGEERDIERERERERDRDRQRERVERERDRQTDRKDRPTVIWNREENDHGDKRRGIKLQFLTVTIKVLKLYKGNIN